MTLAAFAPANIVGFGKSRPVMDDSLRIPGCPRTLKRKNSRSAPQHHGDKLESVFDPEERVNPPLPPLVDFPKPGGRNFSIVPIGIGFGLFLGLLGGILGLSGHKELSGFLNSLNLFRPVGFLLAVAGAESILLFQVLGQILASFATGGNSLRSPWDP